MNAGGFRFGNGRGIDVGDEADGLAVGCLLPGGGGLNRAGKVKVYDDLQGGLIGELGGVAGSVQRR